MTVLRVCPPVILRHARVRVSASPILRPLGACAALLAAAVAVAADASPRLEVPAAPSPARGEGAIEGRVYDPARGIYVERVRLTVEGTSLETFSDADGQYYLGGVPAGAVIVKAFFTGATPRVESVEVTRGRTTHHDITLGSSAGDTHANETIKLDAFTVSTSREMDAAAIAINEQRFAPNIKTVIAADEFGTVVDGTPGEVLKFLPGVSMNYSAGEARTVSIGGAPAQFTPVTVAGFDLASDNGNAFDARTTILDRVSINNMSRIEINHSPTPESSGDTLSGSVNLVPRSAFERSRPEYKYNAFLSMRGNEMKLGATPGPFHGPSHKVLPGGNFSVVQPVSKSFGFTLSGSIAPQFFPDDGLSLDWRGARFATGGNYPDTTPDKPYLTRVVVSDNLRYTENTSLAGTLDFRLSPFDRISVALGTHYNEVRHAERTLTYQINRVQPGDFDLGFTHSAPGQAELSLNNINSRFWIGHTMTSSVVYRHDGPVWKTEVGAGYSASSLHIRDIQRGTFANTRARRTGLTIWFDDNGQEGPHRITVTDPLTGPVDPYSLSNYALTQATTREDDVLSARSSVRANARRDFDLRGVAVAVKVGSEVKQDLKDQRLLDNVATMTPVGPDGVFATSPTVKGGADQVASLFLDEDISRRRSGFGYPTFQKVDDFKVYDYYVQHPTHFVVNPADANTDYRDIINNSKRGREVISAGFLRIDASFFKRRLQLVGGVRGEQTNVSAEGALSDPTLNYARGANGAFIDSDPTKPGLQPVYLADPADRLAVSKITYLDRQQHVKKEYFNLFPRVNLIYHLTDNLQMHGAYSTSIGRPTWNTYGGQVTLPDTEQAPSTSNRISVSNLGLKPWTAKTWDLRLEYYFQRVGSLTLGTFYREYSNFWANTVLDTATPEFLEHYGLNPDLYGRYPVATRYNLTDTVRSTGLEFGYKQALTFLPNWARGVTVFANATTLHLKGADISKGNFSEYMPRVFNWGASLSRPKYYVSLRWNYRGEYSQSTVNGSGLPPGTIDYRAPQLIMDLNAEYYLRKYLGVFVTVRNLLDTETMDKVSGPSVPAIATIRNRDDYSAFWTFGIKGTF